MKKYSFVKIILKNLFLHPPSREKILHGPPLSNLLSNFVRNENFIFTKIIKKNFYFDRKKLIDKNYFFISLGILYTDEKI